MTEKGKNGLNTASTSKQHTSRSVLFVVPNRLTHVHPCTPVIPLVPSDSPTLISSLLRLSAHPLNGCVCNYFLYYSLLRLCLSVLVCVCSRVCVHVYVYVCVCSIEICICRLCVQAQYVYAHECIKVAIENGMHLTGMLNGPVHGNSLHTVVCSYTHTHASV